MTQAHTSAFDKFAAREIHGFWMVWAAQARREAAQVIGGGIAPQPWVRLMKSAPNWEPEPDRPTDNQLDVARRIGKAVAELRIKDERQAKALVTYYGAYPNAGDTLETRCAERQQGMTTVKKYAKLGRVYVEFVAELTA